MFTNTLQNSPLGCLRWPLWTGVEWMTDVCFLCFWLQHLFFFFSPEKSDVYSVSCRVCLHPSCLIFGRIQTNNGCSHCNTPPISEVMWSCLRNVQPPLEYTVHRPETRAGVCLSVCLRVRLLLSYWLSHISNTWLYFYSRSAEDVNLNFRIIYIINHLYLACGYEIFKLQLPNKRSNLIRDRVVVE